MPGKFFLPVVWAHAVHVLLVGAASMMASAVAAHENHAPLPTKGVTIAGDTIMLSETARHAIGLTTAKVQLGDIHRVVTVNARVELPWHAQAMITSLVSGKIDHVFVRPGEAVASGQELARLVSAELATLQLDWEQAKVQVDLAHKLVQQQSELDEQGIIAGKSLLESQAKLAEESAALQIARQKLVALGFDPPTSQQLRLHGDHLPYVPIVSPRDGVITHADVRIGQTVRPTDHLYHVVDPTKLWIVGDVLESDVRLLSEGQRVEASFAALPGETFRGQVDHLQWIVNPQTRTQAVVIAINNSDGRLRPGMSGRVRISVEVAQQAIVCPTDAVIHSRTGPYLLVQRMPGKYENRSVTLGLAEQGQTEVLAGAFPGDLVVVVGNSLLAALLGNEHKARVDQAEQEAMPAADDQVVAFAQGAVELPTDQQAFATAQVEGRVHRILVQPGQQVTQGEVLAEVESLQLRSVQLDLLRSLTHARFVEQSLRRLEELYDQGVVAKRQRWELQSEQQMLRSQVERYQRQLAYFGLDRASIEKLKQADLSRTESLAEFVQAVPVRAPLAGRIVRFHLVPGQVIRPDDPLFEIHDLGTVWVKGFVHERDANRVRLGQSAHVRFTAYPDLEARGTVVRISPMMNENMRVLPVWAEIPNPDHRLKSGMLARITIIEASERDDKADEVARLDDGAAGRPPKDERSHRFPHRSDASLSLSPGDQQVSPIAVQEILLVTDPVLPNGE